MKCSSKFMKYSGYLHGIALLVAMIGTYKQIISVKNDEPASIALSLSLMIMLFLKIPNQICMAYLHSHGWFSVIGTIFGIISFAILTYYNYLAIKKHNAK
jgi:hypothetical protein